MGAAKRIGVTIDEEVAKLLLHLYDKNNTGEMHYDYLTDEIMKEQPNFLMESVLVDPALAPSSSTPPLVISCTDKIKTAVEAFVRKSKGMLNGRDMLHGTFLRFDSSKKGLCG